MKKHNQNLVNLLSIQWNNDKSMIDHILKNHAYTEIQGGFLCTGSNQTPSVQSTIYYNDETPRPILTEDTFIDYNLKPQWYDKKIESLKDTNNHFYLVKEWSNDKTGQLFSYTLHNEYHPSYQTLIRELTTNEKQLIIESLLQSEKKYIKRLKAYFKRYNHKIRTSGYYANR